MQNKKCILYQINGIDDHIHIATHIHPTIALSNLVKDIKIGSSLWIKENNIFRNFVSWQKGYGGFTYSIKEKGNLIGYIKKQQEYHSHKTFREEYFELLKENGIEFDERYWW